MSLLAQYHGTCTDCEEFIIPGERIEHDGDDGYRHSRCGARPEKAICVCEKCWTIHAGECL